VQRYKGPANPEMPKDEAKAHDLPLHVLAKEQHYPQKDPMTMISISCNT
jgi:hypothetical protein